MRIKMLKGMIFDIKRFEIHDGPGIRTTVFLKGCPLRCWWCHNPEGISPTKEVMYFEYKCIHCRTCEKLCPRNAIKIVDLQHVIMRENCDGCGICAENCPSGALRTVGMEITAEELVKEIEKDVKLYDISNGGVTFSGGEPLYQPEFLLETLKKCMEKGINTALDTSGYAQKKVFEKVIPYLNVFLYDIKIINEEDSYRYIGATSKPMLENLRLLIEMNRGKDVILRFPVIPNITDTKENIKEIMKLIETLKGIEEIDLLPFHDVKEKYIRLGKEYKMMSSEPPSPQKLKLLKEMFEEKGLKVKIGG
ncbi:MAG: glycyl-radical enzyme activating protein [Candidatus Methanomethylicia archaeon]